MINVSKEETLQRTKDGYAKVSAIPLFVTLYIVGLEYAEGVSWKDAQIACCKKAYGDDFIRLLGNTYGQNCYNNHHLFDLKLLIWRKVDDPDYGINRLRKYGK